MRIKYEEADQAALIAHKVHTVLVLWMKYEEQTAVVFPDKVQAATEVDATALYSTGIKSFETLAEADPRKIKIVTGRKFPFGNHIKEFLTSLHPKVEIKIEMLSLLLSSILLISLGCSRVDEFLSFIHAVGVDLHENLQLVKESNSNANLKHARRPAQFFALEEVYVIEDDNKAKHKSFA
ncbi:hypothetical protein GOBAR_AA15796 [Gossypium barbadense]|uniref:Uncharacterized protein n=1 Tax=Gossypium barbadense TaxID=3634 RepID=A0A2P5XND1_GOSBA|nr:hypothetical protein GOBAR_AA15796 [Gossypium barbadense]